MSKISEIPYGYISLNSSFETYFSKRLKAIKMAQTLIEKILQQFADDLPEGHIVQSGDYLLDLSPVT